MQTISNADFLSLWERGRQLHPLDRGLLAIRTAFPEASGESVADWPLGRRNRALVELRSSCFGPVLQAWTACQQCGEKIELNMDVREVIEQDPGAPRCGTVAINGEQFRLPTSRDLARLAKEKTEDESPTAAAVCLLNACQIDRDDGSEQKQKWSEDQLEEIGEKLAEADPLAEIALSFQCPACANTCSEAIDLPTFLWTEIEVLVRRLLYEIHTLASAYGWTEGEILALSDARRRSYIEMVQA